MRRTYTDKNLIDAVKESRSIRQTIMKLGLVPAGGNYKTTHANIGTYCGKNKGKIKR